MTGPLPLTLIDESNRCPCCSEDRIDRLVWDLDEMIHCDTCGNVYDPPHPEE